MTDTRKLQLEASLDATNVHKGLEGIEARAATMAQSVGRSGEAAGKGVDSIGKGGEAAAQNLDRATKSIIGSIQRTTAAMEAGQRGTSEYYKALAAQRGISVDALAPYLSQLDAATKKQSAASASLDGMGMSAKQTAFALRGVPAQFTDIATSLASGQRPMMVLLQQGGQLKDMFGGIGPAARALGGYVVSLISPFTIAAAAASGLAYAFYRGAEESRAYASALILSGNAAGTTAGNLSDMATAVSNSTGATKGAAAEVVTALASSGKVAAGNMQLVAEAAVRMQRATGDSVKDVTADFIELGKAPLEATKKLNEAYHYTTQAVIQQIEALQRQGQATEAARLAQETYAQASKERAKEIAQNLGLIERTWRGIKDAASGAVDAMLDVGRTKGPADDIAASLGKVADLRARISTLQAGGAGDALWATILKDLLVQEEKHLKVLQEKKKATDALADSQRKLNEENENYKAKLAIAEPLSISKRLQGMKDQRLGIAGGVDASGNKVDGFEPRSDEDRIIKREAISALNAQIAAANGTLAAIDVALQKSEQKWKTYSEHVAALLAQGVISEKQALDQTTGAQLEIISAKIKAVQQQLAYTADPSQAVKLKGELAALSQQQIAVKQQTLDALAALDKKYGDEATKMEIERLKASGQMELAATKEFIEKTRALWKYANETGNQAMLDELQRGMDSVVQNSRFDELKKQYDALFAEMREKIDAVRVEAERDGGWLAGISAARQADEIKKELIPQLDALAERMRAVSGTNPVSTKAVEDSRRDLKRMADEIDPTWKKLIDNVDSDFRNGFRHMLNHGEGAWSGFTKSLRDTFKTEVADAIYQMFARPIVMSAIVQPMMSALSGAGGISGGAGGFGSLFGGVSNASSIYNAGSNVASLLGLGSAGLGAGWATFGGGAALTGLGTSAGVVGLGGGTAMAGLGTGTAVAGLGTGTAAAGLGSGAAAGSTLMGTIGSALPWVGGALLVGSALGLFGGHGEDPHNNPDSYGVDLTLTSGRTAGPGSIYGAVPYQWRMGQTSGSGRWEDGSPITGSALSQIDSQRASLYASGRAMASALGINPSLVDSAFVSDRFSSVDAAMQSLSDSIAQRLVPNVKSFTAAGESLLQTVGRLISDTAIVKDVFSQLGKTFTATGSDAYALAEAVTSQFGGSSALQTAWSSYYSNFYSQSEQTARLTQQLSKSLQDMGLSLPSTRDGFRALVEAQDLATSSGQQTFATLLGLSSQFAAITQTAQASTDSLKAYQKTLMASESGITSIGGRYAAASASLSSTALLAARGDSTALSSLQSVVSTFLEASKAASTTSQQYARDLARANLALTNAINYTDGSHADGLDYVPFDGYRATLHRGERVQTEASARDSDRTAEEIRALRSVVQQMGVILGRQEQFLRRMSSDGETLNVKVAA